MKLNAIDLSKLRVFCSVVNARGYKNASENLGLTRSAISQAITTLEAQLGRPLFIRTGTKLIPTEDALRFHEEAMQYQQGIERAMDRFMNRAPAPSGRIKIGAYLEFTKNKLMPVIEAFLLENPRAQIQFYFDSPSRLESLLELGKIDLVLSIYPHKNKRIQSVELYQEELCLIGRKDLISKKPESSELSDIPILDYFPSHLLFKRWWLTHFKRHPTRIFTRVYAATAEMVLELASHRMGIGVVPKYLLDSPGAPATLHVIEPTPKRLMDHIWLNRLENKTPSELEKSFVAQLSKCFQ